MKIAYTKWKPHAKTLELIKTASDIIREYEIQGYTLTLRQLYYQLVARDIIPNQERSYKNLSSLITNARMAGMISWYAIEDRNRGHQSFLIEENPLSPINELEYSIQFDQWKRQESYIEVWVEKEALGNVISKACSRYMVPYMSCKGYLSASEAWRAGRRFRSKRLEGKNCFLFHLGDHDPSGLDMTRDNKLRMDVFSEKLNGVKVERIALNMNQVEEFNPPPNPTKLTDSRSGGYMRKFGRTCWELDALKPEYIVDLIQSKIKKHIDFDIWKDVESQEEEVKSRLRDVGTYWPEIKELIENLRNGQ